MKFIHFYFNINLEKKKNVIEHNSSSQGDIFSKCKNKIEEKSPSTATLTVPGVKAPVKSVSSPDLVIYLRYLIIYTYLLIINLIYQ